MDDNQSSAEGSLSGDADEAAILESFKADFSHFDDGEESPQAQPKPAQVSAKESERATDKADTAKADGDAAIDDARQPDNSETSAEQDDANLSSYQRRKRDIDRLEKDRARLTRNRQEFEEGKLKWQQELNSKLAAIEQRLTQPQRPQGNGETRFSANEFARASEWYEQQTQKAIDSGDFDKAKELLANARQTRIAAQQQYQQEQQIAYQQAAQEFQQMYIANSDKLIAEHPELKEPNNETWPKMRQLLDTEPVFTAYPDGFRWAYDWVTGGPAVVSELRKKLETKEKELKEFQDRTQLRGGPTAKPLSTDPNAMSEAENEAFLRREFVQAHAESSF